MPRKEESELAVGSMMNGLQTLPQWRTFFNNPQGATLGLMNSVYPLGKIGSLFAVSYISDRWGRKLPLLIGLIACIIFSVLQGLAKNIHSFIIARALLGFFTSFLGQPSPIIVTELAYPTHREKVTALYNTFFWFGAIFAAWCTYGTFKIESTWSWRIPSLLQGAVPMVQLLGLYFLPESPRWLVSRGRKEEARKVLADYHAGGDTESPLVAFEMQEIEQVINKEAGAISANSWMELIRTPANRERTLIAVILGFFAQWNGVGVVSYYLVLVLNTIGITKVKDQTLINGLLQIFNWLVSTFLGALMVDRLGRRTLFLTSTAGMLVAYIIWTGLTAHFINSQDEKTGRVVVGFIFVYYLFYNIAWNPLLQAYPVEIFPYTLRGRGLSVTYIAFFIGLILGNQIQIIMSESKPTLRWGIVGTGMISSWFLADLSIDRKNAQATHIIQAIGSSSVEKGKEFVETHLPNLSPTVYGSYEEAYQDPNVDIIYIGTPHGFHKKNCLDAISHGKNILCEKAFTLNAREAREVLDAAKAKGVFVMEAMWTRFFPLVKMIQKLVHEEKAIGDVVRLFADFAMDQRIESLAPEHRLRDLALGAGSLLDIGIYSLTWGLLGLDAGVGEKATTPKICASQTFIQGGVEVSTSIILQYPDGKQGIITSNSKVKTPPAFCRIEGTKGHIIVEGPAAAPENFTVYMDGETEGKKYDFEKPGRGFYWEADAVAMDIAAGKTESDIMPWAETVRVMEIMDEVRRQGGTKFPQD
ncbi:unnamed protein product [Fusarium equiseti]|uniref:D-xylose 1-dehydrogenase (NADP(+), D-xylono-1,5-lactone-forming) n=1 Tax=Fusarium equiseti TaxID=61235 RepID=A0A8J2ILC3_FUSEQ|nr:unnamed protein product [Fusarium equiseti]